jgi:hypothetical protein
LNRGEINLKKSVLFIAVLMCSLFIFTSMAFAGYRVNDAGVSEANGLYCATGEISNERPVYQLADTDWEIWHSGSFWYIDNDGRTGEETTYFNISQASMPPLTGWRANGGFEPAPTLSEQACVDSIPTSIPTINEWGMIIFTMFLASASIYSLRKQRRTEG